MIREFMLAIAVLAPPAPLQNQPKKFEDMRAPEHEEEAENLEYRLDFVNARRHLDEARRLYMAVRPGDRDYSYAQTILTFLAKREQQLTQRERLGNALQVVESTWKRDASAGVVVWSLTLKNNSTRPIGRIQYRTRYMNAKGYTMDVGGIDYVVTGLDHTISQTIAPGTMRTIEVADVPVNKEVIKGEFALVTWEVLSATANGK